MDKMQLTFVNVGYGEAILLECPDEACDGGVFTALIDGGGAEQAEYVGATGRIPLADYLAQRGVEHIDLAVSTHIHEDHLSGMLPALRRTPPRVFWHTLTEDLWRAMPPLDSALPQCVSAHKFARALADYHTLCGELTDAGCALTTVQAGDPIPLCAGLIAHVLAPSGARARLLEERLRDLYAMPQTEKLNQADAEMNNYSIVLMLQYGDTRILLPGDTNAAGYRDMDGALHAHLFKLGHHGQRDSATPALLDAISPAHAVCCASSDRRYESAHPALLRELAQRGISCWFSDCPPHFDGSTPPPHHALTFTIGMHGDIAAQYV